MKGRMFHYCDYPSLAVTVNLSFQLASYPATVEMPLGNASDAATLT